MVNTENVLQNIGLEEQEAKVYLALLDLGEATATKIAERTGLGRVHMYQITNRLIERGLMSYVIKNNVRYFAAADPEAILKGLEDKENQFKNILPELKKRQKMVELETKVELYRGREGIKTILKMVVRDKKTYYWMGGAEEACTLFTLDSKVFVKNMEKTKVRGLILARKDDDFFIGKNESYRYIPKQFISSTTMILWGKKTAIFIWSEPCYVILIDNEKVTKNNLATFEYLWSFAEKPSQEDIKKRLIK